MPIYDNTIDLTIDSKFGLVVRDVAFNDYVDKNHKLPWKHRPLDVNDFIKSYKRIKGDNFSDELGTTIRKTFDNKWFIVGHVDSYLFEDFCYEFGLEEPLLVKTCPSCKNKLFTKNQFVPCDKCKLENRIENIKKHLFSLDDNSFHRFSNITVYTYIPWQHAERDWKTRTFNHPSFIKDALR